MKHKRQLLGILLLVVLMPLAFSLGIFVARPPADSADVLALAGAFGGAALTIIGAITVLEWERRMQSDHRRQIVRALMEDVAKFAALARRPQEEDPVKIPFAQSVMVDELVAAVERAKGARTDFPPMNVGMVKAYSTIGMIEINKAAMTAALSPGLMYGGLVDLDRYLVSAELRAKQALAELEIEWLPVTGGD